MPDKKELKPHDMRTKQAKEKLYGTTANRNVIHGMQNKPSNPKSTPDTKKEGEQNG